MPTYRHVCEDGKHHAPLAELVEVAPATYVCTTHLKARDTARDQWAADTNITGPIPQSERTRLNTWRAEQTRRQHGGTSW